MICSTHPTLYPPPHPHPIFRSDTFVCPACTFRAKLQNSRAGVDRALPAKYFEEPVPDPLHLLVSAGPGLEPRVGVGVLPYRRRPRWPGSPSHDRPRAAVSGVRGCGGERRGANEPAAADELGGAGSPAIDIARARGQPKGSRCEKEGRGGGGGFTPRASRVLLPFCACHACMRRV